MSHPLPPIRNTRFPTTTLTLIGVVFLLWGPRDPFGMAFFALIALALLLLRASEK